MRLKLLLQSAAVMAVAALVVLTGHGGVDAGTFNPELIVTLENTEPESTTDVTADFNLPAGDVNFGGVVSFIPGDWGIVTGDKIPIGADIGFLSAQATLGLIGGPCNQELPVEFEMKNASIKIDDNVRFQDTDDSETADYAEDNNGDGNLDHVDKYPDWNNRVFDVKNLQPIRRSSGLAIVAGVPVILQFLVFPPGIEIDDDIPSDATLGYPTVTLLQNAGDPEPQPEPGVITDFCTPLASHNTYFGETADGTKLAVTPQDGTYTYTIIALGQRDADGDGYENSFDTCPFEANVGNPRIAYDGDADYDGLDATCDPNDDQASGGTNSDEDGDGYLNRQDNCPLISNGQDTTNQEDDDRDQIGNDCDPNPDEPDGELLKVQPNADVVIGTGTGEGGPPSEEACPDCYRIGEGDGPIVKPPDDDGGGSSAVIFIVIGVVAALVIVGGGGFFMMRRGGGSA